MVHAVLEPHERPARSRRGGGARRFDRRVSSSGNSTFWNAVSTGIRLYIWKINPTCRARHAVSLLPDKCVISSPATVMVPAVGRSRPPSRFSSVVLPEPAGAHERHEVALVDIEVQALQDVRSPRCRAGTSCPGPRTLIEAAVCRCHQLVPSLPPTSTRASHCSPVLATYTDSLAVVEIRWTLHDDLVALVNPARIS